MAVKKIRAKELVNEIEDRALARYEFAKAIKDQQDETTQVAINRMIAVMAHMAPVLDTEQQKRIQFHNHTWIAVRLMVAAAEWDIRIANFNAPKACARCGKRVK